MALSKRDKEILNALLGQGGGGLWGGVSTVFSKDVNVEEIYKLLSRIDAWPILYEALRKKNTYHERDFTKNHPLEDYEDIFQEAILALDRAIQVRKFPVETNLISYFHGILKNLLNKYFQRKRIYADLAEVDDRGITSDDQEVTDKIILQDKPLDQEKRIRQMLEKVIGPECAERLYMFYAYDYSHKEVEEELQTGRATPAHRIANDCAQRFRTFFCEQPDLLEELGDPGRIRIRLLHRKGILLDLKKYIGEGCDQILRLEKVCTVRDGRIGEVLKNASKLKNNTGVGSRKPSDECQLKVLEFFTGRPTDLRYFGIEQKNGLYFSNEPTDDHTTETGEDPTIQ